MEVPSTEHACKWRDIYSLGDLFLKMEADMTPGSPVVWCIQKKTKSIKLKEKMRWACYWLFVDTKATGWIFTFFFLSYVSTSLGQLPPGVPTETQMSLEGGSSRTLCGCTSQNDGADGSVGHSTSMQWEPSMLCTVEGTAPHTPGDSTGCSCSHFLEASPWHIIRHNILDMKDTWIS